MDFQLDSDQSELVAAVQAIVSDYAEVPQSHRLEPCYFHAELQAILHNAGFVDAGRAMGPLAAALVVNEAARIAPVVELGVSSLVVPQLVPDQDVLGPTAILDASRASHACRNLPVARTLLIDRGDDVLMLSLDPADVEPVKSIYAYPYGRYTGSLDPAAAQRLVGKGPQLRQWARVAIAAEFAGTAQSAIEFTVDYVKQRNVFGRPVGSFQSVQHRLVQCHQIARSAYYLAMRAAWSGTAEDAHLAAAYVQSNVQKLVVDLQQFHGGMGVTNEHLLHHWTYRMRALQGEIGGSRGAALALADSRWGSVEEKVA